MVLNIVFLIFAFVILFWQISLIVAIIGGAPTVYSKEKVIIKAFESVDLKNGQLVADLGCGNAWSLIIASRKFGAKGIGIEISPFYYFLAKINVLLHGETKNIKIKFGNFRKREADIKDADVIYLYLFDKIVGKIEPWIFKSAKAHSKIISLGFPFKNHQATVIKTRPPIYIYCKRGYRFVKYPLPTF